MALPHQHTGGGGALGEGVLSSSSLPSYRQSDAQARRADASVARSSHSTQHPGGQERAIPQGTLLPLPEPSASREYHTCCLRWRTFGTSAGSLQRASKKVALLPGRTQARRRWHAHARTSAQTGRSRLPGEHCQARVAALLPPRLEPGSGGLQSARPTSFAVASALVMSRRHWTHPRPSHSPRLHLK